MVNQFASQCRSYCFQQKVFRSTKHSCCLPDLPSLSPSLFAFSFAKGEHISEKVPSENFENTLQKMVQRQKKPEENRNSCQFHQHKVLMTFRVTQYQNREQLLFEDLGHHKPSKGLRSVHFIAAEY